MAALARLPLFMRLGGGAEIEVGVFELPISGDGTLTIVRAELADMLRSAADAFEQEATDGTA